MTTNVPSEHVLHPKDPNTFRAIAINDPHFAARPPPAFKIDYLTLLEGNLNQVLKAAKQRNVDVIIWGGDLFHLKEPSHNPLWLITRVIKLLTESGKPHAEGPIRHCGIGGNHDLRYGSLKAGLHGSPLELVTEAGAMTLLDREELVYELADGYKVRIAGGSYEHGRAEHVRAKTKKGANHLITVGHFWLGTQTGEFFGEPLFGHDFFAHCETDTLIVGHHHEDKGVHRVDGRDFVAPGSVCITGAHPHDLTRKPAATLIEVTKSATNIKVMRPLMPPIENILDLERHTQLKQEKEEVDLFIANLAQTETKTPDPTAILEELAPPTEVKERTQRYIAEAEQSR